MCEKNDPGSTHGLKTRLDGDVRVLDGDHVVHAFLRYGYPGIDDNPDGSVGEKDVHDFPDGTPLERVVERMNEAADDLLGNSYIEWGWTAGDGDEP